MKRRQNTWRSVMLGTLLGAVPSQPVLAAGWPELSAAPVVGGGEADAALVIGIERYGSVSAVPGATANADAWYAYLTRSRKVPPGSVTLLRDGEGSLEKIRKYAADAATKVKPGGTLWFVFVGHGAPSADGKDGMLVGFDAQQDVDSLYARSMPQKELLRLLGRGKQARTVAVVDACFSGRTASGGALAPGLQPLLAVSTQALTLPNLTLLSAGKSDQFAGPLPGLGRPAFSYLVLGGLRGWADRDHDGNVTAAESVEYAREVLSTTVKDRAQTPELASGDGALVLSRGANEPGPDLTALVLARTQPIPAPPEMKLAAVPALSGVLKEGGALGLNVDVDALVAYDAALRADKQGNQSPGAAASAWERLANVGGTNPYRAEAEQRAAQWAALARNESAVRAQREADAQKLRKILPLEAIPQSQKDSLIASFRATYGADAASKLLQELKMARIAGGMYKVGERGDTVTVPSFLLDYTEVTAEDYAVCVRAGKCSDEGLHCGNSATYGQPGKGNHPINCVDWNQASAYCRAQGKRLPTEEEWEWAAHGGARGAVYPWGNQAPSDQLCWNRVGQSTCAVGAYRSGDSPDGVHDLAGNVWEWTSSIQEDARVARGGGWRNVDPSFVLAAIRYMYAPSIRYDILGFRCARSL